jgi:hypothetical protein
MVAATYVADIDTSRAFDEVLGFQEHSAGKAATSAWSSLSLGRNRFLLASTRPPLDIPPLPLLFYFFFDDLDDVIAALGAAGVEVARMGHPPHALGGEARYWIPMATPCCSVRKSHPSPRRCRPMTISLLGSPC